MGTHEYIRFSCKYCKRAIKAPLKLSGNERKCPACQKLIKVPKLKPQAQQSPKTPNIPQIKRHHKKETIIDLLSDDIASSYFKSIEYRTYYYSLKRVGPKRDFSEELISVILTFYRSFNSEEVASKVESIIRSLRSNQDKKVIKEFSNIAKSLNPKGFELLYIKEEITLSYLKKCYRKASRIHHPDVGGDIENMKIINDAYTQFHEIACKKTYFSDLEDQNSHVETQIGWNYFDIKTAQDFYLILGLFLIEVTIDTMAVDVSFEIFSEILSSKRNHSLLYQKLPFFLIKQYETLYKRLKSVNLHNEADIVLTEYLNQNELIQRQEPDLKKIYTEHKNKLKSTVRFSPILNHPIQVENAFRLGAIKMEKYNQLMDKYKKEHHKIKKLEVDLIKYSNEIGFIRNLGILSAEQLDHSDGLIPHPGYQTIRYEHLSDSQKAEYINTYTNKISYEKARKYLWVRANSYVIDIIHKNESVDIDKVLQECNFLQKIFPNENCQFDSVINIITHLYKLPPEEKKLKIEILKKLDSVENSNIFSIDLYSENITKKTKPINIFMDYEKFITNDYKRLEMYKETGSCLTKFEQNKQEGEYIRERNLITKLNENRIGLNAKWAVEESKKPNDVIKYVAPHIEQLISAINKVVYPGNLYLKFWVERLSIAYTQAKKWHQARELIESFFNLHEDCQNMSKSDREKLEKRLDRSLKIIKKLEDT